MDALNFAKIIPSWLDQDLFDTAIRIYQSDSQAKVTNFDIKAATQPGENFASAVFRATLKFTSKYQKDEKELSVIIKTQPVAVDLPNMEHMTDTTLFETEMAMYTDALPQIQELVKSVGYDDIMCPRLIYQTMSPKPIMILEDVQESGFDTTLPKLHKDFEVPKMIVRRLAKFHAAGFYLNDEKKIDATAFTKGFFNLGDLVAKMFDEGFEVVIEEISKWEGYEKYIEPLKKLQETYYQKGKITYTPNPGPNGYNVLNHGDFHKKNILYKIDKENGDVRDLMTLDFQISVYATPAIDLIYVLHNFVSDEERFTRYDELLATYHEQFIEALKKFGYLKKPPSLLDLQIEMMKNGHFLATNALLLYPFLIYDFNTLTPEDMAAGIRHFRKLAIDNAKNVLKKEIELFLYRGCFGN